MMVSATEQKLNMSVYVASVEISDLYVEVKKIINSNSRPQFLICFGPMKNNPSWFTPREEIKNKMII
jgi:hypothetical protein